MCLKGEDFGWIPGNYVEKIEPNLIPREYKFDEEIAEELDLINQKNAKSQTEILHMKVWLNSFLKSFLLFLSSLSSALFSSLFFFAFEFFLFFSKFKLFFEGEIRRS